MDGTMTALCGQCRKRVPASHEIRDGRVFLVKHCEACGRNEAMISTDAAAWQRKREIWGYTHDEVRNCNLHCNSCRTDHTPMVVLVEVTNRCNMNCPICIASIQSVGFDYHPPIEYFKNLFESMSRMDPRPFVDLYGGEPTMRHDLLDIVKLARKNDLKVRVVTNGLKLADEEYCRMLCECKVPLRVGFDGRHPEIYRRLRGTTSVYERKLKGLENLKKYSHRKHSMLVCLGKDVNDKYVGDLFDMLHEYGRVFEQVGFIPLKEDWHGGPEEAVNHTTPEDVERAIKSEVVDGNVDFIPAGLVHHLTRARAFFTDRKRSKNFMFAGSHPNCESMTFLVSDGKHYRSINHYMKIPLGDLTQEIIRRSRTLNERLGRLDPKKFFQRWYGRCLTVKTFLPIGLKAPNFRAIFRGNPLVAIGKIIVGTVRGERVWQALRRVTGIPSFLRVGVLPFEEYLSVDGQRLANCKGVFAYEDVRDGSVRYIPVCTWFLYRQEILKTIAEKYGVASPPAKASAPAEPESAAEAQKVLHRSGTT